WPLRNLTRYWRSMVFTSLIDLHLREHPHEFAHDPLYIGIDVFQWPRFVGDVKDTTEWYFVAIFGLSFIPLRVRCKGQHFCSHMFFEVNAIGYSFGDLPAGIDDRFTLAVDGWRSFGVFDGHRIHRSVHEAG